MSTLIERLLAFQKEMDVTKPCPNCGNIYSEWELSHTSTCRIDVPSGSICSTLYGVCQKCADNHSNH